MLKIKNLSLAYTDNENIIEDISFDVNEGECILLTGKSGSGKSSIIKAINGLASRYENAKISGSIELFEKDLNSMELYQIAMLISSVFQNPKTHFFNVNTTLELLFFLENIGLSREEMDSRIKEMLEIFPINHLLNRDIFKLSGGEKQILCVAAAYIAGTKIIVLDEPSSNLDDFYTEKLGEVLASLKKRGITLIIAEHRIYYLMDIVDRVFLIKDKKISGAYGKEEFLQIGDDSLNNLGIRSSKKEKLNIAKEDLNSSNEGIVEIKSLSYRFNKSDVLRVNDLSLEFGKIYGIIGKNGCGKSTFTRCFIGVEKSCKDEIYLSGKKLSKRERLKNSSLVMQDVNHQLFTDEVLEEVRLGIDVDDKKIDEVLNGLNLSEYKERHPMSLSGGQKQRVAIASVLLKNSRYIFFDEPTSGMDYENMMRISKLIRTCKREDNIILVISHDVEFLNHTVDDIIDIQGYRESV